MADKRIKSTRLMSRDEFNKHMHDFHDGASGSRDKHDRLHHLVQTNHGHRSAKLSEPTHPDWDTNRRWGTP